MLTALLRACGRGLLLVNGSSGGSGTDIDEVSTMSYCNGVRLGTRTMTATATIESWGLWGGD